MKTTDKQASATKKSIGFKKVEEEPKKQKESAMRDTEIRIMEFITRANYLIELIDICKQSKDVETFYSTLKLKEE